MQRYDTVTIATREKPGHADRPSRVRRDNRDNREGSNGNGGDGRNRGDTGDSRMGWRVPVAGWRVPVAGRRVPEAGRSAPEAGRSAPEAGRSAPEAGRSAPHAGRRGPHAGRRGGQLQGADASGHTVTRQRPGPLTLWRSCRQRWPRLRLGQPQRRISSSYHSFLRGSFEPRA